MNAVEQIKAEIERLKNDASIGLSEYDAGHENGICDTCDSLLSFIDSLQDSCPKISDDLDEEGIIKRAKDLYPELLPLATYICGYGYYDCEGAPIELIQKYLSIGANWQKEQDKETIELAEDHAYFAGKEKMREALLEWAKSFTEPQILVSDLIDKINEV